MASGRRSSARLAAQGTSSPPSTSKSVEDGSGTGSKRKAGSNESPTAKRGKKQQKTLEETMPDEGVDDQEMKEVTKAIEEADAKEEANATKDVDEKDDDNVKEADRTNGDGNHDADTKEHDVTEPSKTENAEEANKINGDAGAKEDDASEPSKIENIKGPEPSKTEDSKEEDKKDEEKTEEPAESKTVDTEASLPSDAKIDPNKDSGAIEVTTERASTTPAQILEKGLVYFFTRARVTVEGDPQSIKDIARTYIILRPLPQGASLTSGTFEDLKNSRLLALPKKVFPRSHKDNFMTFVEKVGATLPELKESFAGSTYSTQTTGVRHSPAMTPIGEGVYALTTTGAESSRSTTHLAYILTLPNSGSGGEPGQVQEDFGLAPRGSFILSVKNPAQPAPPGTSLPDPPQFDKETMDEFGGLRWMPVLPKHLDTVNAQVLMIGEAQGDLAKAVQDEGDDKDGTDSLEGEVEKLSEEELARLEGLKGDDSVFDDLGLSAKEFSGVTTTW